jgi:hypothetical protein
MDNHTHTRADARPSSDSRQPDHVRDPATAMRILDARESITAAGHPMLVVLVDRIPLIEELTYRAIDLDPEPLSDISATLYIGVHPDGFVTHLVDRGDGQGLGGATFDLRMRDGAVRRVIGPYQGDMGLVRQYAPDLNVRVDIGLVVDRATFIRHHDGRGSWNAALTPDAADAALRFAAHTQHGQAARAFPPLDRVMPRPATTLWPDVDLPGPSAPGRRR